MYSLNLEAEAWEQILADLVQDLIRNVAEFAVRLNEHGGVVDLVERAFV